MRSIRGKGRSPRRSTSLLRAALCALAVAAFLPAVAEAAPTLQTTASDAVVGGSIHDTATLSNDAILPTGTVTFDVYGAADPTCASAPVATFDVVIGLDGVATSPGYPVPTAGLYHWIASFHDDPVYADVPGVCGADNETSSVAKANPTLTSTATDARIGDPIHATATLSSAYNPTGTMTFRAFGAGDSACAGPVAFNSGPVTIDQGDAASGDFSPPTSGTYRWKVSYSGDAGNNAVPSNPPCSTGPISNVASAHPTLTTFASDVVIGGQIHDAAFISGAYRPTGQITFRAYGPGNVNCTGTVAFNSGPVTVEPSKSTYGSGEFSPPTTGTYRWTATYSGDSENITATSTCNSANGVSTVALKDVRPEDMDADGTPDSIDDCPVSPGPGRTNGCTGIDRFLSLDYKRGAFRGILTPVNACGTEERVTVLAKRHGRTRKVGSATTSSKGTYTVRAKKLKGSYYVRSLESLEPTTGLCLAIQSKRILAR